MWQWIISLDILSSIYFWVAVAATVLLIVQIIMMLFSFGGDADVDLDGDGLPDDMSAGNDSGIGFFTLKGITVFFSIGAWVGLLCVILFPESLEWLSILPAFISGMIGMVIMYFAMKGMAKMQSNGNIQRESIVGKEATVYVSIRPSRTGRGKVTMTAQGQYIELDAVTDEQEKINVDEKVIVCEYTNGTAVVKRTEKN